MRTSIIGRTFIELDSVDSTNKYAADLVAAKKAPHGTVILAHEQTHGRGQRGRIWKSAAGLDIALSVVLQPDSLRAGDQFALSMAAALAVHDVVADAMRVSVARGRESVRIKWPNDVLIDRRKVSGILIKNEIVGGLVASTANITNENFLAAIRAELTSNDARKIKFDNTPGAGSVVNRGSITSLSSARRTGSPPLAPS